jgi:hypothetical protein
MNRSQAKPAQVGRTDARPERPGPATDDKRYSIQVRPAFVRLSRQRPIVAA